MTSDPFPKGTTCCERGCENPCAPWSRVRCAEHYQEPRYGGHAPIPPERWPKLGKRRETAQGRRKQLSETRRVKRERSDRNARVREKQAAYRAARRETQCSLPGCSGPVKARGLCGRHYEAQRPRTARRHRDGLPIGYFSDASIYTAETAPVLISCEQCRSTLGLVHSAAEGAMRVHHHQVRVHVPGEAWRAPA